MQIFIPREEMKRNPGHVLFLIGLLAFCATILLKPSTNSISVGIIIASILVNKQFYKNIRQIIGHPIMYCLLFFYGLHLLSVFNSANVDRAFKDLVLKLPLVVIPLSLRLYRLSQNQVEKSLNLILLVVFLVSVHCLVGTFITMLHGTDPMDFFTQVKTIEWGYFSYILPAPIDVHAPYLSLYAGTGVFICFYFLNKPAQSKVAIGIYLFTFFYLFSFAILLSSRTPFVALTFTLLLWLFFILVKKGRKFLAFGGSLVIIGLAAGALTFIPYLNNKVKNFDGLQERTQIWTASANIFKENPVFGIGIGDIKESLVEEYKRINFAKGVKEAFNAHNQYLQTALGMGIIGFLALLFLLGMILYYSWAESNYFLLSFVVVFSLCCLTESFLSRQSGVVLFSFMVGVLLNSLEKKNR